MINSVSMMMLTRQRLEPSRPKRLLALLVLCSLVVIGAGCGSDDDSTSADSSTTTGSDETTTTASPSTTSSAAASSSTTEPTMPGQPIDGFPGPGDVLAVVGVAHDDVLNVRELPGTDQSIVATAGPTADDVVATGQARELPASIWYEVTVDGETGWAGSSFLAFVGTTDDATSEFLAGAAPPLVETMVELADLVAADFASEDPPSKIVQSVAPEVGDLGEISYDVIGIGDDAVAGYRLHIFGTPAESGEGFGLKSIERTTFCTRGVDGELCT